MQIECPNCCRTFEIDKSIVIQLDWRISCPHCDSELEVDLNRAPSMDVVSKDFVTLSPRPDQCPYCRTGINKKISLQPIWIPFFINPLLKIEVKLYQCPNCKYQTYLSK